MASGNAELDFQSLYTEHSGRVYGFLVRRTSDPDLAQDLLQEVFMRVFRYIESYDPARGELGPWIGRIAANTLYSYFKRSGSKAEESELIEEALADSSVDHADSIAGEDASNSIREAIDALPEPTRSVLIATRIEGKTLDEAAELFGMSRRTVSRRLLDAVKLLRKELEQRGILD